MWSPFTLDSLIENWGMVYEVSTNTIEGDFDDFGEYQKPENDFESKYGIICIKLNNTFVPDNDTLGYTMQDKYCITRDKYDIGNYIRVNGSVIYRIHEEGDYSYFDQTNLNIYIMKRVGRLDEQDD